MKLLFLVILLGLLTSQIKGSPGRTSLKTSSRRVGIFNGKNANILQYPFAVALRNQDYYYGTGVILGKTWILTTAENAYIPDYTDAVLVRAGSTKSTDGGQTSFSTEIFIHPRYQWEKWDYNVGLIKVIYPFKFNKRVQPIRLATKRATNGTHVILAGWGSKNSHEDYGTTYLQMANLTAYDWNSCKKFYKDVLTPRMVCTFDHEVATSDGDSGDPLVDKDRKILYGLAAGGYPPNEPIVYADISNLRDWILETMKNN